VAWHNGEWVDAYDLPSEVKDWCPQCDPDGIPDPWMLRLCGLHIPPLRGPEDERVNTQDGTYWSRGSAESGGESNAAFCEFIHRKDRSK